MARNFVERAVVLRTGRFGDIHKSVSLFSADRGVFDAVAYGALKGKGKLAGATEPFTAGMVYLYYDPVKRRYKIVDLDVESTHEGLIKDLRKYFVASLWAEILVRSFGGGEDREGLFELFSSGLDLLESAAEDAVSAVNCQYLWRFMSSEGYRSDLEECSSCGNELRETSPVYLSEDADLMCGGCASRGAALVSTGVIRYLRYTEKLPFDRAVMVGLTADLERAAKGFLLHRIQHIIETPLMTLESGRGMI